MTRPIPDVTAAFLDARGNITRVWRDYLRSIPPDAAISAIEQQLAALAQRVGALEDGDTQQNNVIGQGSVETAGDLTVGNVFVQLIGDESPPAALRYYGTDETGARGFHALPVTGVLPLVTGEILNDQPVLVCAPDGSLIYAPVA